MEIVFVLTFVFAKMVGLVRIAISQHSLVEQEHFKMMGRAYVILNIQGLIVKYLMLLKYAIMIVAQMGNVLFLVNVNVT